MGGGAPASTETIGPERHHEERIATGCRLCPGLMVRYRATTQRATLSLLESTMTEPIKPHKPPVPKYLDIKPRASTWAQRKLEQERLEKAAGDETGVRQLTVRMPAEQVAFIDAIAERFKVSRNATVSILLGSACGDVYEALPTAEREALLAAVSKFVGHPVRPYWDRDPPANSEYPTPDEMDDIERRHQV